MCAFLKSVLYFHEFRYDNDSRSCFFLMRSENFPFSYTIFFLKDCIVPFLKVDVYVSTSMLVSKLDF